MKYRIEYPILFDCNLQCHYCFHADYFNKKHPYQNGAFPCKFTIKDYKKFRNTHLNDVEEIILSFHGGETFHKNNVTLISNIMKEMTDDIEQFDMLSNGMCDLKDYEFIAKTFQEKIWRIGFTFHRNILNEDQKAIFINNVQRISEWLPGKIYVKELLRTEDKFKIMQNKMFWGAKGIPLKVQDYKGDQKGADFTEYDKYTSIENMLIDSEYKHPLNEDCSCLKGYRTFNIRGYDQWSGDIVACWLDPVVVGNIQENWFSPNYKVCRKEDCSGQREVKNVEKIYRGTYEKDRPIVECI